jgi:hypothetical protein
VTERERESSQLSSKECSTILKNRGMKLSYNVIQCVRLSVKAILGSYDLFKKNESLTICDDVEDNFFSKERTFIVSG